MVPLTPTGKATVMTKGHWDLETYRMVDDVMSVLRTAVRKAQAESRRLGVANVYSFNGQIYYELPGGEITRKRPDGDSEPGQTRRV